MPQLKQSLLEASDLPTGWKRSTQPPGALAARSTAILHAANDCLSRIVGDSSSANTSFYDAADGAFLQERLVSVSSGGTAAVAEINKNAAARCKKLSVSQGGYTGVVTLTDGSANKSDPQPKRDLANIYFTTADSTAWASQVVAGDGGTLISLIEVQGSTGQAVGGRLLSSALKKLSRHPG